MQRLERQAERLHLDAFGDGQHDRHEQRQHDHPLEQRGEEARQQRAREPAADVEQQPGEAVPERGPRPGLPAERDVDADELERVVEGLAPDELLELLRDRVQPQAPDPPPGGGGT